MEQEHRDAIRKQFSSLVEQTDLDLMVSTLFEKGVFSDAMIEPYKDTSNDMRSRKRQLYRDITRRGPHAFDHLLDSLMENGYWDLVRALDPKSYLHKAGRPGPSQGFLSISETKRKNTGKEQQDPNSNRAGTSAREGGSSALGGGDRLTDPGLNGNEPERAGSSGASGSGDAGSGCTGSGRTDSGGAGPGAAGDDGEEGEDYANKKPKFNVIKSTKFFEDNGGDIKLYRTRGRNRGVLVLFSYVEFKNNIEKYRRGAMVDIVNLKDVFSEIGFKVLSYTDLSLSETKKTLAELKNGILGERPETVFVVFSSHGHARAGTVDTDIRCSDGRLLSYLDIIDYFNNERFPALLGIPKVFIFQVCRGSNRYFHAPRHLPEPSRQHARAERERGAGAAGAGAGAAGARTQRDGTVCEDSGSDDECHDRRVYSDIIIANSTVPGYASNRDVILGSWYIQALCAVLAARAHDLHVADLLTLVDEELRKRFAAQTSSVDRWGFNRHLYLHPGLYED